MVSLAAKRRVVGHLLAKGFFRRFCCKLVGLSRGASRMKRTEQRPELRERIVKLSEELPRFGFRRIHACLVTEVYRVNKKAVHRIWRDEGLSIRSRKRKRISVESKEQEPIIAFGDVWSIDYASEWLDNRRQARIVGIVDVATRENLLLKTRPSIRSCDVVKELEWLFLVHGRPKKIRFDNGPEFRSNKLTNFLQEHGVEAGFIEPGPPW